MLRSLNFYRPDTDLALFSSGLLLLLGGLLLWIHFPRWITAKPHAATTCTGATDADAPLSSQKLEQLAEYQGAEVKRLEKLLGKPYCHLPRLSIRADVITDRAVYRLEDGQQLIVAYEEGVFVGHSLELQSLPQEVVVQRDWQIQAGDTIGGHPVVASLGDLSIRMQGVVHAPESGTLFDDVVWIVDNSTHSLPEGCAVFVSPQLPTYLSRLCGLRTVTSETVQSGQAIAQVQGMLHFSLLTLRHNSDQDLGWQYVAPSPGFLSQFLGA